MNALIIGAGGFVGGYLIKELLSRDWTVCATKLPFETISVYGGAEREYETADLDILNEDDIFALLDRIKPDCIFHLAAQSSVAVSWKRPALTADINIKGAINLLEAVRRTEKMSRIIFIGSGEEYGYAANMDTPVSEDITPDPGNIYAVTKYTQNMIGRIYANAYKMDILSVRAFNHIGPGQAPQFVISDFCRQAAEIVMQKRPPEISVGNLSAKRDFTDVRDIVRAYAELAVGGKSGETYNVGSGRAVEINTMLERICSLSGADIRVRIDQSRFRPADIPFIAADITKLQRDTGWSPKIDIDTSIRDILEYWKNNL